METTYEQENIALKNEPFGAGLIKQLNRAILFSFGKIVSDGYIDVFRISEVFQKIIYFQASIYQENVIDILIMNIESNTLFKKF